MNDMKRTAVAGLLALTAWAADGQQAAWNTPGCLNPIVPGYFADPTIRKFGDTYYIYATTDGTGNGYGPAQVWVSKDFRHWRNVVMNWPTTEVVWAPDVVRQPDGTYRYYYCEPCNVNVGEGDSPLGPWRNVLGAADAVMVPDRYVHNVITLDPQLFRDDDGSEYLYFTTWGIYKGFGCGVAKLRPGVGREQLRRVAGGQAADGREGYRADARGWSEHAPFPIAADDFFSEKRLIPNTELTDIFEAPFVFKRKGVYYFTYSSGSCHDDTYRVQYATSEAGPMGPFQYKGCILKTNADGTIHGPGHHSMLEVDGQWYIVYHRHNNPHSIHGFNRQVCIDRVDFDAEGNILPVEPTHGGVDAALLCPQKGKLPPNLAYRCGVKASSVYSDDFRAEYAVDDNNGTLWRAARCCAESDSVYLELDLGRVQRLNQVWIQFEYATFFYQYKVTTSEDGSSWTLFADKTRNTQAGSPMIEEGDTRARYIRIYITDTQKNGHMPAIWNVQVYNATKKSDPKAMLPDTGGMDMKAVEEGYPGLHKKDVSRRERLISKEKGNMLIDINADDYAGSGRGAGLSRILNRKGGYFDGGSRLPVEVKAGKQAFFLNGRQQLTSSFDLPATFVYNAPYTIVAWTLNPKVSALETVLCLSPSRSDLATTEFRLGSDPGAGLVSHNGSFESSGAPEAIAGGAGKWQHWVITFDGYMERIYLDGKLLQEKNNFIMVRPQGPLTLGASADGSNRFSGYIHSLQLYDKSFSEADVQRAYSEPSDTDRKPVFGKMPEAVVDVVSPELLSIRLVDEEGEAIETGLLDFRFAATSHISKKDTVGLHFSAPSNNSSILLGTDGKKLQKVFIHIKDDTGTVDKVVTRNVTVDAATFTLTAQTAEEKLSFTTGARFNEDPVGNGSHIFQETTGDFVMQARITGIDGQERHSTPAYNEGGILLSGEGVTIQLGVFPAYNCGNMLTVLSRHGRPQHPNGKGWNYDPYLQLERRGSMIYARTSRDGTAWEDIDGSPLSYPELEGRGVKLGLYQTTYNENVSWVTADSLKIYTRK